MVMVLEGMACQAGRLTTPAEGFGQRLIQLFRQNKTCVSAFFFAFSYVSLHFLVLVKKIPNMVDKSLLCWRQIPNMGDKASLDRCKQQHRYHKNLDLIDLMINDLLSLNLPKKIFFVSRQFCTLYQYFLYILRPLLFITFQILT